MKARRLHKREFARAVRHGLGCAYLHVKEYGDKEIEEELLNACLTNLVYDRQIDSRRASWLAGMLDATGRTKHYAEEINRALTEKSERTGPDFEQLVQLASELFNRGFDESKAILLKLVPVEGNRGEPLILGEALVDVAALVGLEIAARMMVSTDTDTWEKHCLYEYACEEFDDKEEITKHLQEKSKEDPLLLQFWREVEEEIAHQEEVVERVPQVPWTLEQVLDAIENQPKPQNLWAKYRAFGKTAADSDLKSIVDRMEKETDSSRVCAYLSVFSATPLPIVSADIVRLLFSDDKDIRRSARNALANCQSAEVRQAALEALQREHDDFIVSGINLLKLNYEKTDLSMVSSALRRLKDIDDIHWGAMAAIDIAERTDDDELTSVLAWVYEFTPCGSCRRYALKKLIKWGTATAQILHEAQWDAEGDIRWMARAVHLSGA